jgi:hypothetical protein
MVALRRLRHTRISLGVAAVAMLVTALTAVAAHATAPPTPTQIHSSVSSAIQPPCQPSATCGNPGALIVQNTPFNLHVSLTDDTGTAAAFNKDTTLTLAATGPGSIGPTSVTMLAGASDADFAVSYSTYANGVTITVASTIKGKNAPAPGTTAPFTVLQTLHTYSAPSGQPFQQGAGDNNCADVSAANPICGVLLLPNGANSNVLLSTGSCVGIGCDTKGTVTQFIGDISGLYTKANPAALIIECYRQVCGKGGVHQLTGLAADSQLAGALVTAPPCPAKNTIGADQDFCTDQVQNNRLNADDSLVYILFADDFRGSI